MTKDEPAVVGTPSGSVSASRAVRWGVAVVAVAYIGYLALLVTCDLRRIAPLGFVPMFKPDAIFIADVTPDSIAARAGLQAGDRITRANGQVLEGGTDWQRVRVYLNPSKPLQLEIDRGGRSSTVSLLLPAGVHEWGSSPSRPGLLAFRFAQVITLAFALIVAFKRSFQPPALLGALLLASVATFSLVLPMRMAAFWHALPPVPGNVIIQPGSASACLLDFGLAPLFAIPGSEVAFASADLAGFAALARTLRELPAPGPLPRL